MIYCSKPFTQPSIPSPSSMLFLTPLANKWVASLHQKSLLVARMRSYTKGYSRHKIRRSLSVQSDTLAGNDAPVPPLRRVTSVVCALLALLVLVTGSTEVGSVLLGRGVVAGYAGGLYDAAETTALLLWPLVLLIVWIFGYLALLVGRGRSRLVTLTRSCLVSLPVPFLIVLLNGNNFPMQGLSIALVIVPLITLNVGAIYGSWRFLIRTQLLK